MTDYKYRKGSKNILTETSEEETNSIKKYQFPVLEIEHYPLSKKPIINGKPIVGKYKIDDKLNSKEELSINDGQGKDLEQSNPQSNELKLECADEKDAGSKEKEAQEREVEQKPQEALESATEVQKQEAEKIAMPKWKNIPVPDGPDKYSEFTSKRSESPEGYSLIGARARGKKHKHEGTNCDDWFEFETSGQWTVIAVSDGAGSKQLSRVGARTACQASVNYLAERLKELKLAQCEQSSFERNRETGEFVNKDLKLVQKTIHEAIQLAYDEVERSANERSGKEEYKEVLGREVKLDDLSSTLLLAVHTTIRIEDKKYSLIISSQIGDGYIAVVTQSGKPLLLGIPEGGEYSGQTEFLTTSKRKLTREYLNRKTFIHVGPIKALMVMTDGVSDDYFPHDPEILTLYSDLLLNSILDVEKPSKEEIAAAIQDITSKTLEEIVESKYYYITETNATELVQQVRIRTVKDFSNMIELEPSKILNSKHLLVAGALGEPMSQETNSEEKLKVWLDSYYVRGSFDDRTMVILNRKDVI